MQFYHCNCFNLLHLHLPKLSNSLKIIILACQIVCKHIVINNFETDVPLKININNFNISYKFVVLKQYFPSALLSFSFWWNLQAKERLNNSFSCKKNSPFRVSCIFFDKEVSFAMNLKIYCSSNKVLYLKKESHIEKTAV